VIFAGAEHDLAADLFEAALRIPGIGTLVHPFYGEKKVVPLGEVKRTDALKTAANQTTIEVTFWETSDVIYPANQENPTAEIFAAIVAYETAIAQELADEVARSPFDTIIKMRDRFDKNVDIVKNQLQTVADTQDDVRRQFDAIYSSIDGGLDAFIETPLELGIQAQQLIKTPARVLNLIGAKLSAYGNLAASLINSKSNGNTFEEVDGVIYSTFTNGGEFRSVDGFASGYSAATVTAALNEEFTTRTDAITTAEAILDQWADLVEWRDLNFQSITDAGGDLDNFQSQIDTGESYQQLQKAVTLAAGYLVQLSFSLKQERRITLTRARTPIDLIGEYYRSASNDDLDYFINTNALTGSEILEVPAGREVVFFV
jgi:hypothetical protein